MFYEKFGTLFIITYKQVWFAEMFGSRPENNPGLNADLSGKINAILPFDIVVIWHIVTIHEGGHGTLEIGIKKK